jgi:hypothetical protein
VLLLEPKAVLTCFFGESVDRSWGSVLNGMYR